MARIFISYRRSETRWAAGRLYDRLVEAFGRNGVFLDVTDIEPGEDFSDRIRQIIDHCDVLLAVIGPNWLTLTDRQGVRRLDQPQDLVRIEIVAALQRNIRVIPVLLDDSVMPGEHDLPGDLAALARRNAREISYNRFHADLDSFVRVLERILAGGAGREPDPAQESVPTSTPPLRYDEMPFTVSIETVGGVATPLLARGRGLPAEEKQTFSTADDNQAAVTIHLSAGERSIAGENVALGRFEFSGIPPAPRGVPQLQIRASVDTSLVLTVTATDLATGLSKVLDAVDLARIEPPPTARDEAPTQARPESARDSKLDLGAAPEHFKDIFGDIFGQQEARPGEETLDQRMSLTLSTDEATRGGEKLISLGDGRTFSVKLPTPVRSGQVLRLRGLGQRRLWRKGDLYLQLVVADA
jgi:hypothetical protein